MSIHAKFLRANNEAVAIEARRAGEFGVHYVHLNPTFKRRTGNLQDRTESKIVRTKSGSVIRLMNKAKYANAIESGSKKHKITGRPFLRFVWKGVLMYRRYVMHPGTKPYKFLYRATYATGRVLEAAMRTRMQAIAKAF